MNRYVSRKFWFAVGAFLVFTGLRCFELLDQDAYVKLAGSVVALYLAANVVQKATAKNEGAGS